MNQIVYFFLLLITGLNLKNHFSLNWLILFLIILFFSFKKYKKLFLKYFLTLGILIFTLNPKIKKWPLKNQIEGKVIEVRDNYFIINDVEYKVLIYSYFKPKLNQKIKVQGDAHYFIKQNFYQFNFNKYYGARNVAYFLRSAKITTPYQKQKTIQSNYVQGWFDLAFMNKKTQSNRQYYETFTRLGLAHIIIISSYHFQLFFKWLVYVFSFFVNYFWSKIITLIGLFLLTFALGFKTSMTKALLFIFLYVFLGRKKSRLWCLSVAGLILVLINPKIINDNAFLMTFGFSFLLMFFNSKEKIKKIFALKIMGSFIEWIFTGRIALLNFVYIFLSFIILPIYVAIFLKQEIVLKIIYEFLNYLSSVNYYIVIGFLNIGILILFLLIINFIYSLFINSKARWINGLLIIACLFGIKKYKEGESYITFINVGQGDSALVKIKEHNYLIDVGKKGSYTYNLKPYFLKEGIKDIDYLKISHPHSDHNGGLQDWDKDIKINNHNYLKDYFKEMNFKDWNNVNDNSSVLLFTYQNTKVMFTGDIGFRVEDYLIKNYPYLKIDILKVAHHGSKYSTSLRFLKHFQPKYAIISAGFNKYSHPHNEVVKRLKNFCQKVFITKENGAIKYNFANKTFLTSHF